MGSVNVNMNMNMIKTRCSIPTSCMVGQDRKIAAEKAEAETLQKADEEARTAARKEQDQRLGKAIEDHLEQTRSMVLVFTGSGWYERRIRN